MFKHVKAYTPFYYLALFVFGIPAGMIGASIASVQYGLMDVYLLCVGALVLFATNELHYRFMLWKLNRPK